MIAKIAEVRRALEQEEVVPHFQPLVELHTGRLAGFEVLARWVHPRRSLVLPENFISLAEKGGLIEQLMQQILRKAFLSAPTLPKSMALAVNVSPTQLLDLGLPNQIRDAADTSGFPLNRLTIEIVAAIIGLGHSLGLITVGEGVETEKQADMLLCLGCEMAQGWLYGRAVPADQISAMVAAMPNNLPLRPSTPKGDGGIVSNSSLEARPVQRLAQLQAIYDGAPVGLCFPTVFATSVSIVVSPISRAPRWRTILDEQSRRSFQRYIRQLSRTFFVPCRASQLRKSRYRGRRANTANR